MTEEKKRSILSSYNNPYTELEIRLKGDTGQGKSGVSKEVFISVYNGLINSKEFTEPDISYTVNFDSKNVYSVPGNKPDDSSYIRSLVYDPKALPPPIGKPAKLLSDTYYKKVRMDSAPVRDFINYSINLNKEVPITKAFSTKPDATARAKIRASFMDAEKKWRYDITAVCQTPVSRYITEILNQFFIPLNANNFIEKLNYENVNLFEIEIEHVGENKKNLTVDDFNVVKKLFHMINPEFSEKEAMQEEIYHIAQYVVDNPKYHYLFKSRFGMKKLANQPITLTLDKYEKIFPPNGFLATNKADGQRCIISITGNRMRLISGKMIEIFHPKNASGILLQDDITILDAELIFSEGQKGSQDISLYVFDVMVYKDENCSRMGYEERIDYIDEAVQFTSSFISKPNGTFTLDNKYCLKKIEPKKIFKLDEPTLKKTFNEIMNAKYPYKNDGIIIATPGENYSKSTVYKWKPLEDNTIDFLAMKVDKSALLAITGSENKINIPENHSLYFLFVGIDYKIRQALGLYPISGYKTIFPTLAVNMENNEGKKRESYYPIQFSPSFDPLAYIYFCPDSLNQNLDHKIVEMRRPINGSAVNMKTGMWDLVRIREDRKFEQNYFGNDFIVAESVYQNYIIAFPIEMLWTIQKGYFETYNASEQFQHMRDMWKTRNYFQRFIIGELINNYGKDSHWVVDLASGRGADIARYQKAGVKEALFIDIDKVALGELVQRKMSIASQKRKENEQRGRGAAMGMKIHTLHKDLKENSANISQSMENFGFRKNSAKLVMMNFAIHYLCDKTENIRNLAKLVNYSLNTGGYFIFTTMSGKKIHDILRTIGFNESWKLLEDNTVKYEIRKLYKGTDLADVGQKIAIRLPFKEELAEEPLCNIEHVINVFSKNGFELHENTGFSDMLKSFEDARPEEYQNLTNDDKLYSGLHNFVILRKISK